MMVASTIGSSTVAARGRFRPEASRPALASSNADGDVISVHDASSSFPPPSRTRYGTVGAVLMTSASNSSLSL